MEPGNKVRTILIIEDHEGYVELLKELCQSALNPLKLSETEDEAGAHIHLAVANTLEEAENALKERDVYLATVDINLSGDHLRGQTDHGMKILEAIKAIYPKVCPVVISSEDTRLYQKKALRNYEVIDYIQKSELGEDEAKIKHLFKTTFIYAEALRLFESGEWSQAEKIWRMIVKENPEFAELKDTKNLGLQLNQKKNALTGLPGREWVWNELDRLRKEISGLDWAIMLVNIEGFNTFRDSRKLREAEEVLIYVADLLKENTNGRLGDSYASLEDLLKLFQNPGVAETNDREIFLGEIDNTGLFVLVTPSQQLAEAIKQAVDPQITEEITSFHSKLERGDKDLLSANISIITAGEIRASQPLPPIPRDVFEQLLFGKFVGEAGPNIEPLYDPSSPDDNKKKKKKWYQIFSS